MLSAPSAQTGRKRPERSRALGARARAFSLMDVLVSIGVIAVLISLLLPSLGPVKETARQVACRSGVRQIGLGIAMFADDHRDLIPASLYLKQRGSQGPQPAQTVCLTVDPDGPASKSGFTWDGLGVLYAEQYLGTPGIFYCPSHKAQFRFSDQEAVWHNPDGLIVGNYQYRAMGPNGKVFLSEIEPKRAALVSDSLRSADEFNHPAGVNVLRADLSVFWFSDHNESIYSLLGKDDGSGAGYTTTQSIGNIWNSFDEFR